MIVNGDADPGQVVPPLVKRGVTAIFASCGPEVVLVAVNEGIFPVPLEASPMELLSLVQLNVVEGILPENWIVVVDRL